MRRHHKHILKRKHAPRLSNKKKTEREKKENLVKIVEDSKIEERKKEGYSSNRQC
jgi:hypothetical protein